MHCCQCDLRFLCHSTSDSKVLFVVKYKVLLSLGISNPTKGFGLWDLYLVKLCYAPSWDLSPIALTVRFNLALRSATSALTTPNASLKQSKKYETIWTIASWALSKTSMRSSVQAIPTLEATSSCGLVS